MPGCGLKLPPWYAMDFASRVLCWVTAKRVRPFYPDAKIDEPFELAGNVDRIVVTPAEALVYLRK